MHLRLAHGNVLDELDAVANLCLSLPPPFLVLSFCSLRLAIRVSQILEHEMSYLIPVPLPMLLPLSGK